METVPICRADPCEDVPGAVPHFSRCARKTEGSQQWRGSLWFAFTLLVWVLVKFSMLYYILEKPPDPGLLLEVKSVSPAEVCCQ